MSIEAACVLVAAGQGERLNAGHPKAFVEVAGRPLVWHAFHALNRTARVGTVVAVVPAGYEDKTRELFGAASEASDLVVVPGGPTRQESVASGLAAVPRPAQVILVHDAARCLAPPEFYDAVVAEVLGGHAAVIPGLPVVDTLKQVDGTGVVVATPKRSALRAVQTPQGFRRDVLEQAHAEARARGEHDAPDDASLVERLGVAVHVVAGHEEAFKITRPYDLLMAEAVLRRRQERRDGEAAR